MAACGRAQTVANFPPVKTRRLPAPAAPVAEPAALPPALRRRLETAARRAAKTSYSPYSRFPVGAAIVCSSGKVFTGCNVENASYGLCNCAERTAIFSAVATGERVVRAVVVYTPTASPSSPCGACRQIINEFGPDAIVISVCDGPDHIDSTLDALLPSAFGPKNLA
jgi:cytidine deaminase